MSEPDPLRRKRLGLRSILLVSGGVLVAGSVLVTPLTDPLAGEDVTADVTGTVPAVPATPSGPPDSSRDAPAPLAGSAGAQSIVPVYWWGDVGGRERLFREFAPVTAGASGDPIVDAVRLMTSGTPLDPDYSSPWSAASSVSSSISTQNVITLDISSDAFPGPLAEDDGRLAIQQLVYTVTAAAADAGLMRAGESSSVVVLVDGMADHRAFGSVELHGEWTRDPSVLAPVWIIDPQEGVESDTGEVTVHGLAPAAEASVRWRITRVPERWTIGTGLPFQRGRTGVERGDGTAGTYSFAVALAPGHYEVVVSVSVDGVSAEDSKSVVVK